MASLDDIYSGIIKPGPQGGIYQPGPDVQFPNSNVSRVTPEGLNVRSVSTYGVDGNGNPIAKPSASQLQALKIVAAALQPPGARGTTSLSKDQTRLTDTPSPMLAFDGDQGTGAMAPGVAAINGAMMPPAPRIDPRGYFLRGNPGQTDWSAVRGDNGLYGIPAQGFATQPNSPPVMRAAPKQKAVMAAPRSSNRAAAETRAASGPRYTGQVITSATGHNYAALSNPGDRALQKLFTGV